MKHYRPMNLELHSRRLKLSPLRLDDVDLTIELFTDPEVRRFAGGVMTEDEVRRQMADWVRRGGNGCIGIWCIAENATGAKLGTAALLPMPIAEDQTDFGLVVPGRMPAADIEVGFFLRRSVWMNGYATEACRRLLRFAFEATPLREVVATFDEGNSASRNVLLKAGFIAHGTRRCYGEESPDFRITRDDWRTLHQLR